MPLKGKKLFHILHNNLLGIYLCTQLHYKLHNNNYFRRWEFFTENAFSSGNPDENKGINIFEQTHYKSSHSNEINGTTASPRFEHCIAQYMF